MDLPLFHPKSAEIKKGSLSEQLRTVARTILLVVAGLIPIFFLPTVSVPFATGKAVVVLVAVALAALFLVLAILRDGSITLRVPLALIGIWSLFGATLASALLSGDIRDSLFGNGLQSQTAIFMFLLALIMTVSLSFSNNKQSIVRLYGVLIFSALVLSVFHLVRLAFGPEVFSFSLFTNPTSSLIGSWNGLAIFSGLVVVLVMIALQQLPFSQLGRYISYVVLGMAILMLAIINFSPAWWVLAIFCGVTVLYNLVRNFWNKESEHSRDGESGDVMIAMVVILVVAVLFIVGGAKFGSLIGDRLGISYLEVRPSLGATVDIAKSVYQENLLLGVGPNRFIDAWRINRDPAINQTIFWNTDFDSGFSYLATIIINTGLLGTLALLAFIAGLVWCGIRFVMASSVIDRFWRFIGLSSLASSVYLLVMAMVYVPPPTILMLWAFTTGIFLATYTRTIPIRSLSVSIENGRVYGMALLLVAVTSVSVIGYGTYSGIKEVMSIYEFNSAIASAGEEGSINSVDDKIVGAFEIVRNDIFAAQIAFDQLSIMRSILTIQEPTSEQQQAFQAAASRAIEAANLAVSLDPTDPNNHRLQGQIYAALAFVGVEGAGERAKQSYDMGRQFDPRNPTFDLLEADLALVEQDIDGARAAAEEAISKKVNFTEALFFLAQLDINEGNLERAIAIVTGVAQLEPQNPARRYQLGILLASNNQLEEAMIAFESAVVLDPQYANARYFLALGYAEQGRTEEAIEQLKIVKSLNESNGIVDDLIAELEDNGRLSQSLTTGEVVPERDIESGNITEDDLDSGLISSPNPVPEANDVTEEEVQ